MKDSRFLLDGETKYFKNIEEQNVYLEHLKADVWAKPYLSEIQVEAIPSDPISIISRCEELELEQTAPVMECAMENGIFLSLPVNGKRELLPIRETAYNTMLDRLGLNCSLLKQKKENAKGNPIPLETKAETLALCFRLKKEQTNVLIRDEKISALHSQSYAILPINDLIKVLEEELLKDHEDYSFEGAEASHEYFISTYRLNDEMSDESIKLKMEEAGASIKSLKSGVMLATSDVGYSSATVYPFLDVDGIHMFLGRNMGITHKKGKEQESEDRMEEFRKAVHSVGNVFRECEDEIERLGNQVVNDVPRLISNIVDSMTTLSSSNPLVRDTLNDMYLTKKMKGTGIDVYLGLLEVLESQKNTKNFGPRKYIEVLEEISRYLDRDFSEIEFEMLNKGK